MLARGQIHIDRLAWDVAAKTVQLELTSGKPQTIKLRMPTASEITSDAEKTTATDSQNALNLKLPEGKSFKVELRWK